MISSTSLLAKRASEVVSGIFSCRFVDAMYIAVSKFSHVYSLTRCSVHVSNVVWNLVVLSRAS